jgi:hypothetical protein
MKSYLELSNEELLDQERQNFSAHMALIYKYLKAKDMSIKEFNNYIGNAVSAGWKEEVQSLNDYKNGILLNVLANGGKVISDELISKKEIRLVVSDILYGSVMKAFGATEEMNGALWDKFYIISEKLGFEFSWKRDIQENYEIRIKETK